MKKGKLMALFAAILLIGACGGGSGGGSSAVEQAEVSFDDLVEQVMLCLGNAGLGAQAVGVAKATTETCDCDGGGQIVVTTSDDLQQITININNCISPSGYTYNGALNSTDGGDTINGTMDKFGVCSNGTATNIDGANCTGSTSLTCPAGNVNCTVVDSTTPDECDLSC